MPITYYSYVKYHSPRISKPLIKDVNIIIVLKSIKRIKWLMFLNLRAVNDTYTQFVVPEMLFLVYLRHRRRVSVSMSTSALPKPTIVFL